MKSSEINPVQGLGRLIQVLLLIFTAAGVSVLGISFYLYSSFSKDLPSIESLVKYDPPVVSEVFADDGTKIGEFWSEFRLPIPFEEIPEKVIQAFVTSEDASFFEHGGIDPKSILRAFIKNMKAGRVVQGGSTITQQVARSLLLSRERTFARKIKEAILATRIEKNFSKEHILFLYLNQIFLGNRSHGIRAAARNYFHKEPKNLTLAEITMIAGLPSAPSEFSPTNDAEKAKERQHHVLMRMIDKGYISKTEANEAMKEPLKVYRAGTDKDFNIQYAPYFTEQVRRYLHEKYGEDLLYKGGLKIETTVDLSATRAAQKALRDGLHVLDKRQEFRGPITHLSQDEIAKFSGNTHKELLQAQNEPILIPSLIKEENIPTPIKEDTLYKAVIIAKDGKTKTIKVQIGNVVGNILYRDHNWARWDQKVGDVVWAKLKTQTPEEMQARIYNPNTIYFELDQRPKVEGAIYSFEPVSGKVRAMVGGYNFKDSEFNRVTQALRQPGSAFKPIIYAAALDKGYTPSTQIMDAPITFQIMPEEYWSPRNYGGTYRGPMTFRGALVHSVNVVAVKIFHDIGIEYTIAYARKLGMTSPLKKVLSAALGSTDISLEQITRIYGTFAANGVRPNPILVKRITNKDGIVLEENHITLSPNAAQVKNGEENENLNNKKRETMPSGKRLNSKLFAEQQSTIEEEKLKLSNEEISILYGEDIPAGYVMTPKTAYIMNLLLSDVAQYGTGHKASELGRPSAGKTGTTNDETDAWYIGYTPDLITGVWVGYDELVTLGKGETGGRVATPIWTDYMKEAFKGKQVARFTPPAGVSIERFDLVAGGSATTIQHKPVLTETPIEIKEESTPNRAIDFLSSDIAEPKKEEKPVPSSQ